jgi:hypothetical protein
MLSLSFRCDQIYKYEKYDFRQILFCYLSKTQCFYRDRLVILECKQNMTSLRGQASWAKMTSLGGQANSTGMPPYEICKQSCVTNLLYDNKYTSFIDIYFYEFFQPSQTSNTCTPKHLRHPVWHFGKCLCFSLIKIEPVSINPSQAVISLFFFSFVHTFLLK